MHDIILNLDLPEDEVGQQYRYIRTKRFIFSEFIENVKVWQSDAGDPYMQYNGNETDPSDHLNVTSDAIHSEYITSNMSKGESAQNTFSVT